MRIAIDCCDLDCEKIDGTRVYIKNILNYFGKLSTQDDFLLFHQREFNPKLKPNIFPNYQEKKVAYPFWWTQTRFSFELSREKPAVCFMPIQQIPLVRNKNIKFAVTIHDLAWKYFPQNYAFLNRLKLDFFAETAIRGADKLIAISESTKNDILKFYPKTNPDKISVVYHGFDRDWWQEEVSEEQKKLLEKRFKLERKKFLLYVGGLDDKENVAVLVDSFNLLKKKGDYQLLKLVLVGEKEFNSVKTLEKIKQSPYFEDIIVTGRVSFTDLRLFYRLAKIFVLPSKYEGFGLPILEAFASKVPVVAVNSGASAEVGASAAEYFDGNDEVVLAEKLGEILKDEAKQQAMITAGLARSQDFSWEKCARETLAAIKSLV